MSEHALDPGVAPAAREALDRLCARRDLLDLPLSDEAGAFFR